jgi:hypothetical protein
LGATAYEQLTVKGDPILIPPVVNASGQPEASAKVILKADPLAYGDSPFNPVSQPTLATTETNSDGLITSPVNLGSVIGNASYVTASGVLGGIAVFTQGSSGALTFRGTATEYIGSPPQRPCCGQWIPEIVDLTQTAWELRTVWMYL